MTTIAAQAKAAQVAQVEGLKVGRVNHACLLFIVFAWLTIAVYGIALIALIAMAASAAPRRRAADLRVPAHAVAGCSEWERAGARGRKVTLGLPCPRPASLWLGRHE